MNFNMRSVILAVSLSGLMLATSTLSTSATTATQAAKIKLANASYSRVMSKAKDDFRIAIKPSYDAVVAIGKPAEQLRRTKVKAALAVFSSVVATEKAPVIAAEKAYKAIISKLVADRTNAQLKLQVKATLLSLKNATQALKADSKVKMAKAVFAKQRIQAMTTLKTTLFKAIKTRQEVQKREIAKFNSKKIRAKIALKVAIKAALAGK